MDKEIKCVFCGKPATKLCDFPLGYTGIIFDLPEEEKVFDYQGHDITADQLVRCSRPMCDECATHWRDMDFCPHCIDEMKKIIIAAPDRKKEIRSYIRSQIGRKKRTKSGRIYYIGGKK